MLKLENFIAELTRWIDNNIHKPIKIEDVATRSGYSKWHLQRVFFQVTHVSLAHYIRERKLALAASDLIQSSESILAIAHKYGFDSQQSFTRVFAKKYQSPPSRFRRMNEQTPPTAQSNN